MAKPISAIERLVVSDETKREQDLKEIEASLANHKEAVLEAIDLLGNLHDRGILSLLNGLFSKGDEVLRIMVQEVNQPNNSRVLGNLLGLTGILGSIDIDRLKILTEKANNGLKEATETDAVEEPGNVFELLKVLKDPEVNRSIGMLVQFLKGMGKE